MKQNNNMDSNLKETQNILINNCISYSSKRLFTFNASGNEEHLTGKMLFEKVNSLGGLLQDKLEVQDKVIILFPQSLDYVYSLLSCIYANLIAVPIPIADLSQSEAVIEKTIPILEDSHAACIITNSSIKDMLKLNKAFDEVLIIDIDESDKHEDCNKHNPRPQNPEDIAIMLYTSGSTSQPKGAMLSHRALLAQASKGAKQWSIEEKSCIVTWMPQFHSFGLIFNIMAPLLQGAYSVILPTNSFVKNPEAWFRLIDNYKATHTGAPNFAFDMCCSLIDIDSVKDLSLATIKAVICGGEPVSKATYESFTSKFKAIGFKKNVFCPHYGMSETGSITTKQTGKPMKFLSLDIDSLSKGKLKVTSSKTKSKAVTSCGEIGTEDTVLIVNPDSCKLCASDEIGEIWVNTISAATGYHNRKEETEHLFAKSPEGSKEELFLRTGDLGFIKDNHLYIIGREKEVIIIHGKNHHPVDIEWTIKKNVPRLTLPLTVFSYEVNNQEKVVVVQEVDSSLKQEEYKEITQAVLFAVLEIHGLEIYEINLVEKGSLPKTGSGKIQRKACRNAYTNKQLPILYQYRHGVQDIQAKVQENKYEVNQAIVEVLIKDVFSPVSGIAAEKLDETSLFSEMGLDSIKYVQVGRRIEDAFKIEFLPIMLFKHQSIGRLAEFLSSQVAAEQLTNSVKAKKADQGSLSSDKSQESDIAVIGMSCNFPGKAIDLEHFWSNIINKKDCITSVAESRPFILKEYEKYYGDLSDSFPQWGGFIEDTDKFDAAFFGISPLEAESMDPQQRKAMELTWSVIEDAGYNPQQLAGQNIGLFLGVHGNDYSELVLRQPDLMHTYGAFLDSGLHMSLISHRPSRWYDFHGPSEVINTACSSSLIALHHAVESIYRGESSMAIAGGINLVFSSRIYRASHKAGMLSHEGHCKTFDKDADGFVKAEGYGAVMLKPLSQAIADKDNIYGVIKSVTINHDGKSNSLRAPNLNAQKALIKKAYEEAELPVETISFIETHGTGTPLGDPIEFQALQEAFEELNPDIPYSYCGLGTVKTSIGHCESAAGIAGLIKVMLSMRYKTMPGILHFKTLNPYIKLEKSPFHIVDKTTEWKRLKDSKGKEQPYRAGLSSFGFGGANAHVIMEEYIPKDSNNSNKNNTRNIIIPISAKNKKSLQEYAEKLMIYLRNNLENNKHNNLSDIAYTLQTGRAAMEERAVFCVSNIQQLIQRLEEYLKGNEAVEGCWSGRAKLGKNTAGLADKEKEYKEIINKNAGKSLDKLAQLWIEGVSVDWNTLYKEHKPGRINLPTYQFAKNRYWIPEEDYTLLQAANSKIEEANNKEVLESRELHFIQKHWEYSMPEANRNLDMNIAILTSEETKELAKQLAEHFAKSELIYADSLDTEFQQKEYDGFVDLLGCGIQNNKADDWILQLQKLIEQGHKNELLILCVTKGLETYENNNINLAGASRAGLYRMLQNEYSHIKSRHMDLDADCSTYNAAQLIAQELSLDSSDNEVCYRSGKRYKAYLGDIEINIEAADGFAFPEEKVLLITGGTRGLGYLCAQHFIKRYGVKKLVLTGREQLPPKEQWNSYINDSTATAKKIRAIQDLEKQGVQVKVLSVALSDENAVQKCIKEIKDSMGHIGGIIHCAGLDASENPAFIRKTTEEINIIAEPKIAGLEVLYKCLKEEPLKLFVLFSSVSAIIPSLAVGHSDYAMANAYMDYFAQAKADKNCRIVSIQWPNWKEAGMGEVKSKPYEQAGLLAHSNAEGLEMLDRILNNDIGAVVLPAMVRPDTWNPRQLLIRKQNELHKNEAAASLSSKAAMKGNTLSTDGILNLTQIWLKELFAKELRMEAQKVDIEISFQDYGVDSVLLTQLTRSISKLIKQDLDPSLILEYSNINDLSIWLTQNHKEILTEALGSTSSIETAEQPKAQADEAVQRQEAKQEQHQINTKDGYSDSSLDSSSDIAIIGLSCRFPGGESPDEYWKLLSEGRSAIKQVPKERWGYENSYYAGMLDNITQFDPKYFHIPEEDAKAMDPQALVLLEESLKLWYNAGYTQQEIKAKAVGVYIGARSQYQPGEYELNNSRNPVVVMGQNYLAANISQYFDLRGPSIVLDTACSSALVSMNMAIQALNSGEIECAMVGGVSLLTTDKTHQIFGQRGILSKEPNFHIFDKQAKGVVLGEGVGMVLLKHLDKALQDGDKIHAVIKGLAINNDGRTAGPATPNLQAQREVLQKALQKSGKKAEEISYIEVNGSGTEVTDLLELKAIQAIYNADSKKWALGSMKPNIGHPLCAEGIASFIKVVLMLEKQQIVPFISGRTPMTHYNIEASPYYFCKQPTQWTAPQTAAINCFADGGTNAHVILEAWQGSRQQQKRTPLPLPQLNKYDVQANNKKQLKQTTPEAKKPSNWWTKNS